MKLNLTKCAFRVSTGKFLGFIVNSREIEANLDKIRAGLDMRLPSNTKEVQHLTERIAARVALCPDPMTNVSPSFKF